MNQKFFLVLLLILFIWNGQSKAIYDFKKSYVNQLTNLNFKDQV